MFDCERPIRKFFECLSPPMDCEFSGNGSHILGEGRKKWRKPPKTRDCELAFLVYTIGCLLQTHMGFKPKRKSQAPQRVGDLLKSFFDVNMPKNIGEEGRVLSLWSRAVGQDISRQTHPVSFRSEEHTSELSHSQQSRMPSSA